MKFLDTNILVYAADDSDSAKFEKACQIIELALQGNGFMLSAQVLNEFVAVMIRKLKKPADEVRELLSVLSAIHSVPVMPEYARRALDIKYQYGLQFYDSLLLAAAEANGCDEFWSEDLGESRLYCGMKVVNPFK